MTYLRNSLLRTFKTASKQSARLRTKSLTQSAKINYFLTVLSSSRISRPEWNHFNLLPVTVPTGSVGVALSGMSSVMLRSVKQKCVDVADSGLQRSDSQTVPLSLLWLPRSSMQTHHCNKLLFPGERSDTCLLFQLKKIKLLIWSEELKYCLF